MSDLFKNTSYTDKSNTITSAAVKQKLEKMPSLKMKKKISSKNKNKCFLRSTKFFDLKRFKDKMFNELL